MIGILIELIVSWLLIWFFEKKDLAVLGVVPSRERIQDFAFGIFASASASAIYFLAIAYLSGGSWTIDGQFSFQSFLTGLWWTLKSVLFEELIFRGVLLYIAIKKLGTNVGCIASAVSFGIYHWFSYNIFGNPLQMGITFIMTGIAGLMFACAFAKTKSLFLPIGLHYGYNFVSIVIFSNGPLGEQWLTLKDPSQLSGVLSTIVWFYQILALPFIVFWYLRIWRRPKEN